MSPEKSGKGRQGTVSSQYEDEAEDQNVATVPERKVKVPSATHITAPRASLADHMPL